MRVDSISGRAQALEMEWIETWWENVRLAQLHSPVVMVETPTF